MNHPTEFELQQFAKGELDDARFEEVAIHVELCEQCSTFLEQTGAFPKLADGRLSLRESSDYTHDRTTVRPISEGPGSVVGPYKLLQQLGEGGMGVVYMAEQETPVRRMVALKIIKPGMDSQQVIARFEAERQALAMMDHHHIAKVLDAGTTDTGRPYFAMELVKGVPITEYCDRNKLTPRERLEMFIPVCHAIQHAHQKGIIHRDIKPSNVLVTLYDGKPVPKVIDFGIAKATQQKLTERTMFTGIGQILGTLEYMSPEQAEMNQLDVDTRTDVYSLGVMLYELLTGSTPITKEKLRSVGLEEMLRTIRETEPPKPSTRLSDSGEALPSISAVRKTEPTKLSRLVRGDLDWIVMKALEKDRTRRYETATGLATDIQRFLSDEAVTACPPSASYKFRKFARRNKVAIVTGTTIASILIAATITSSSLAVWALRAQKKANESAVEASTSAAVASRARATAEANETMATREAVKSKEVATFLKDMLKGVGPSVAIGRDTKMLMEILNKTAARLDSDLEGQPEVQAELRITLGDVYEELGKLKEAEQQFNEALDLLRSVHSSDNVAVANAMQEVGEVLRHRKRFDESSTILSEAMDIKRRLLGNDHQEIAKLLRSIGETHIATAIFRNTGARMRSEFDAAEKAFREALSIFERCDPNDVMLDHAEVLRQLTTVFGSRAEREGNEQLKEELLAEVANLLDRRLLLVRGEGADELKLAHAWTVHHKASLALSQKQFERTVELRQEAADIAKSVPSGRLDYVRLLLHLASSLMSAGRIEESRSAYDRWIVASDKLFGSDSSRASMNRHHYAQQQYNFGFLEKAAETIRQVIDAEGPGLDGVYLCDLAFFLTQGGEDPRRASDAAEARRRAWQHTVNERGENAFIATVIGRRYADKLCMIGEVDKAAEVATDSSLSNHHSMWHGATVLNRLAQRSDRNLSIAEHAIACVAKLDPLEQAYAAEQAAKSILFDQTLFSSPRLRSEATRLAEVAYELTHPPKHGISGDWQELALGMARYREGTFDKAERVLQQALDSSEDVQLRTLALTFLAMTNLKQGKVESAQRLVDELGFFSVLSVDPSAPFRYSGRIDLFAALSFQAELRSLLGGDQRVLSDPERITLGLERQTRHVRRNPDDSASSNKLAMLLAWYGKNDEHDRLCARLIGEANKKEDLKQAPAAAMRFLCRPSEDIALIEEARRTLIRAARSPGIDPYRERTHLQLGAALAELRLGNLDQAEEWLNRARPAVVLGTRGRWHLIRSLLHSRRGEFTDARNTLHEASVHIWPGPNRNEPSLDLLDATTSQTESDDTLTGDDYMLINWMLLDEAKAAVSKAKTAEQRK